MTILLIEFALSQKLIFRSARPCVAAGGNLQSRDILIVLAREQSTNPFPEELLECSKPTLTSATISKLYRRQEKYRDNAAAGERAIRCWVGLHRFIVRKLCRSQ